MRNHGAVTVGSSIGEAFIRMWYLEKACRNQLTLMQSGGDIIKPSDSVLRHCAAQYKELPNPHGYSEWNAMVKWFMAKRFDINCPIVTPSLSPATATDADAAAITTSSATYNNVTQPGQYVPMTPSDVVPPLHGLYPVAVRGRRYLAGSNGNAGGALLPSFIPQSTIDFPKTYKFYSSSSSNNQALDLRSTPSNSSSTVDELRNHIGQSIRHVIDSSLVSEGALLFKSVPTIKTTQDFSDLMTSIGYPQFDYTGFLFFFFLFASLACD